MNRWIDSPPFRSARAEDPGPDIEPDLDLALNPALDHCGILHLTFVDDASGAALPDLEYVVFSERRGDQCLARGRSSTHGTARIEKLPEDVLLIQAERRPPNCAGFKGLWLSWGEERELEIRIGCGGCLTGRVVDDLGNPLEGIQVMADNGPAASRRVKGVNTRLETAAVTDRAGQFRGASGDGGSLTRAPHSV